MFADSPEALQLGKLLETGKYGSGGAACMAYLTQHDGILGSNNLSDVKAFCIQNNKCLLTTANVMHQAYKAGLISIDEAVPFYSLTAHSDEMFSVASEVLNGSNRKEYSNYGFRQVVC